jgi:hypothetical protein
MCVALRAICAQRALSTISIVKEMQWYPCDMKMQAMVAVYAAVVVCILFVLQVSGHTRATRGTAASDGHKDDTRGHYESTR